MNLKYFKLLYRLLDNEFKKRLIYLLILLCFGIILEALGIGLLVPLLKLISNPNSLNDYFEEYVSFIQHNSVNFKIYFILLVILILYIMRAALLVLIIYYQNKFIYEFSSNLSNRLFYNYFYCDYKFQQNLNISEASKNLLTEINSVAQYLISAINFVLEFSLGIGILLTLYIINSVGAISIFLIFSIISFIFYRITKKKIKKWGKIREINDNELFKITNESLRGLKEVIVYDKRKVFIENFKNKNLLKSKIYTNFNTLSNLPKNIIELAAVIIFVSFISIQLYLDNDLDQLLITFGVFFAAIFRLLPSLNKLLFSIQAMKFYEPSINVVDKIMKKYSKTKVNTSKELIESFNDRIVFKNVSFKYESEKIKLFNNINFTIEKNKIIGIKGESGSGKSTLINLLLGLLRPISGEVLIDNVNIQNLNILNLIGYVNQETFILNSSLKNNIVLDEHNLKEDKKIQESLRLSSLENFAKNFPLNKIILENGTSISGGQKQRIGIARALYKNSEILIFDEPTSALDEASSNDIIRTILSLKHSKTIIISSHDNKFLANCDYIIDLDNLL